MEEMDLKHKNHNVVSLRSRSIMYVQQLKFLRVTLEQIDNFMEEYRGKAQMAYIVHDRDEKKGKLVEPHIHLFMYFKQPVHLSTIANKLNDDISRFELFGRKRGDYKNGFSYLIHETKQAIAEKKVHYETSEVVANFDYDDFMNDIREALSKKQGQFVRDMIDRFSKAEINKIELRDMIGVLNFSVHLDLIKRVEKVRNEVEHTDYVKEMTALNKAKQVIYIYGESGIGKSSYAKKILRSRDYFKAGASNDPFQFYTNQRYIFLEELRHTMMDYSSLLELLDPYEYDFDSFGRYFNKKIMAEFIVITTTLPPDELFAQYQYNTHLSSHDTAKQLYRRIKVIEMTRTDVYYRYYDYVAEQFNEIEGKRHKNTFYQKAVETIQSLDPETVFTDIDDIIDEVARGELD